MSRQSSPILLTRPAAQGDRFAADLRDRFGGDIRIIDSALLAPRFLAPVLPQVRLKALIFTSETGVQGFQRIAAETIFSGVACAWCVGNRTAQAAREAGLQAVSAQGDVVALTAAIKAAGEMGPLLHLRGRDVRGDLVESLNSANIETYSAIVYAQEQQPLTPQALACLQAPGPVLVPLFSPRTASILRAALADVPLQADLWLAALSPAVAEAAEGMPRAGLAIAKRPDAGAMIETLQGLIAAGTQA
ncbi:uroporphyrinogen-III synthase [Rhodobacter ferrooxidans]|uniref:Uroporphyrinogen III synthase HEM4 n=1 Tax=Rhodobacter ferrooxidans TaxID=371731 RepID=C8S120_9RHOB|nr:uroporphyrinogen-III synthase [Rhodobacter sp. SW2]EEW25218.1 Uroporphyrinogen III synthase HEM4 [Rhodobacter sp. SW2]